MLGVELPDGAPIPDMLPMRIVKDGDDAMGVVRMVGTRPDDFGTLVDIDLLPQLEVGKGLSQGNASTEAAGLAPNTHLPDLHVTGGPVQEIVAKELPNLAVSGGGASETIVEAPHEAEVSREGGLTALLDTALAGLQALEKSRREHATNTDLVALRKMTMSTIDEIGRMIPLLEQPGLADGDQRRLGEVIDNLPAVITGLQHEQEWSAQESTAVSKSNEDLGKNFANLQSNPGSEPIEMLKMVADGAAAMSGEILYSSVVQHSWSEAAVAAAANLHRVLGERQRNVYGYEMHEAHIRHYWQQLQEAMQNADLHGQSMDNGIRQLGGSMQDFRDALTRESRR